MSESVDVAKSIKISHHEEQLDKDPEVEVPFDSLYEHCQSLIHRIRLIDLKTRAVDFEMKRLQKEEVIAKNEAKRIQSVPLVVGQYNEKIDSSRSIVSNGNGSNSMVHTLSFLNQSALRSNSSVGLHRSSSACVKLLPPETDSHVSVLESNDRANVTYSNIGGLDIQKQEIQEAIELPLTHRELYQQIGIDPPNGVLLYGPPGTGKTMLAKAVAYHTNAAFIRVSGSEFVQKYLGEGPRMVRDVFRLARERAPCIIFIDEVDSIATKRYDAQTGADREVQRILIELLNQMDGFDRSYNVKVIMATNRWDTLDPALLRPGRLDRKIEFPYPNRREKRLIFQVIASKMSLADDVSLEAFVTRQEKLSGADIAAICQEAGMQAIRNNRYLVKQSDFEKGYAVHARKKNETPNFYE